MPISILSTPEAESPPVFDRLNPWRTPLPALERKLDRWLVRVSAALTLPQVRQLVHCERLLPSADPFILAANHSSRREVVLLTALLMLIRGGRPIHFLADWNFRLIPGVAYLYDHSGAITVSRKPARPAILNRFRARHISPVEPHVRARQVLEAGGSLAIFPEGRINRRSDRLLHPRSGAARLAIETGAPVVPMGIRFVGTRDDGRLIDTTSPIEIAIGTRLAPPECPHTPDRVLIAAFKTEIMEAIAALCGKPPSAPQQICTNTTSPTTSFDPSAREERHHAETGPNRPRREPRDTGTGTDGAPLHVSG